MYIATFKFVEDEGEKNPHICYGMVVVIIKAENIPEIMWNKNLYILFYFDLLNFYDLYLHCAFNKTYLPKRIL
ncbi:hypothetical protein D0T08_06535 [Emticicia sp. C21]|nr:hypothetical protein D0T08_06535 [Emticicia sp. C21]